MGYGRLVVSSNAATELVGLFKHQLEACRLRSDELCVVVTDSGYNPTYGAACTGAALDLGAEVYQITLPYTSPLPRKSLGGAWKEADLLVYATTHALHYADAMREGLESGLRALAVMQPLHVLRRLIANEDVIRRTKAGAELLERARIIRITSDAGTELTMDKTGRRALANCGAADEPGSLDFWGAGMVETAQLEGTAEGILVLDTGDIVFHLGRYVDRPVKIAFEKGRAVKFEGGLDAFLLQHFLESFDDENALMAGHTSWGTDHRALWTAQAIRFPVAGAGGSDTEAYYGNVQVQIGSNTDVNFNGQNATRAHLGICMLNCNVYLDDEKVIDHGEFLPEALRKNQ